LLTDDKTDKIGHMKIILCDDEKEQMEILSTYINDYACSHHVEIQIEEYSDCDTLWWDMQSGTTADLFMLDIQMKHMTGIQLAHKMREACMYQMVCFITGIKDYVFEGYDVDAAGYILKPFERPQIDKVLDKAVDILSTQQEYSVLQSGKDTIRLYHTDIIGLEAVGHDTKVYLKHSRTNNRDDIIMKLGINEFMAQVNMELTIIHRSYAVNMRNILQITKEECIGENDTHFPIARGRHEEAMQAFIKQNRGSL
jgi:Response regulator of the LytR/AlgR family